MRSESSAAKWATSRAPVGEMTVASAGAAAFAGTHTNSAPIGPKKMPDASMRSRAAPREATMRSPSGDQATL